MSLVAYGSSDDSDESDQEDVSTSAASSQPIINVPKAALPAEQVAATSSTSELDPPISDEDDDFMATEPSHSGLSLPPPKYENVNEGITLSEQKQVSVLQGLPKPKAPDPGLVDNDEGELEDFVKRKPSEKSSESPMAADNGTVKKRKLVQITVPALPVDSDDEEETSKKQKTESGSSKKKCGLFDVLPAPRNESFAKDIGRRSVSSVVETKDLSSNAMETESSNKTEVPAKSKIFVPASVARKSKQPSSQLAFNLDTGMMMPSRALKGKSKAAAQPNAGGGHSGMDDSETAPQVSLVSGVQEDSDEEGEGHSNFFSLTGEDKMNQEKEDLSASSYVATASVSSLPAVTKQKTAEATASAPQKPEPLTFSGTAGPELQDSPLQFKSKANMYGSSGYSGGYSSSSSGSYGNAAYNYANVEAGDMEVTEEAMDTGGETEDFLHDKEFLKFQGKGRQKAEEINFIDVHQDDQMSNVDVMKGLSEESNMMSHSKKKNKDMPSSQQKRKHQITYLAFRAKERELELKNQWADNRATKKQTQAKYGF